MRVFLTHNAEDLEAYYGRALPQLTRIADVERNTTDRDLSTEEVIAAAVGCDVIVAHRSTPGEAELFERLPNLLVFLRCAVDTSTIDVDAASANGVLVARADKSFVASTAELALGLLLASARNIAASTMDYATGRPPVQRPGRQLRGQTAGIIGYGSIGSYLVELLAAIGMNVLVHDPFLDDRHVTDQPVADHRVADQPVADHRVAGKPVAGQPITDHHVSDHGVAGQPVSTEPVDQITFVALDELLRGSDVVFPLAPGGPDTTGLIGSAELALMKPGATLINVGRGELLDEVAVVEALTSGRLGGVGMDVGQAADQRPSPDLAALPGVVATPHVGGLTPENADAQALSSVEQVAAILAGVMPPRSLNAEHATRLRGHWAGARP